MMIVILIVLMIVIMIVMMILIMIVLMIVMMIAKMIVMMIVMRSLSTMKEFGRSCFSVEDGAHFRDGHSIRGLGR